MKNVDYLSSTISMLKSTYPDGISDQDYYKLLKILYEEMSDRNISEAMFQTFGFPKYKTTNDLYYIATKNIDVYDVLEKLKLFGYEDWLLED